MQTFLFLVVVVVVDGRFSVHSKTNQNDWSTLYMWKFVKMAKGFVTADITGNINHIWYISF